MAVGSENNPQDIPKWICKSLSRQQIEETYLAVKSAETKTAGEIVPMIVKKSVSTDHVVWILMLINFSIVFLLDIPRSFENYLLWSDINFFVGMVLGLLFFLMLSFYISYLLSKLNFVKNLFTSKKSKQKFVSDRALLEFYKSGLYKTKEQTGILIFISMLERQVVILGDKGINEKIKSNEWQSILDELILSIKSKNLAQGLKTSIEKCAKLLETHFPARTNDENELSNQLIIKD